MNGSVWMAPKINVQFLSRWFRVGSVLTIVSVGATACRPPHIQPLTGVAPAQAVLPSFSVTAGQHRLPFRWEMNDHDLLARGDGVARIAGPDSARVDLFLAGGFGSASAILIGDSMQTPPGARMVDLVPPSPLLWAALGRLAVPALADTVIRVAGDTLRAEIGRPVQWRILAIGSELRRVERVAGDRIVEFVARDPATKQVRYELAGQRSLQLTIGEEQPATFNASIWQY